HLSLHSFPTRRSSDLGPLSGASLALDGAAGLAGWQWLFLLEGLPAVALGVVVLATLPERPDDATWLTAEERQTLVVCLRHDMEQDRKSTRLNSSHGSI